MASYHLKGLAPILRAAGFILQNKMSASLHFSILIFILGFTFRIFILPFYHFTVSIVGAHSFRDLFKTIYN